MNYILAVFRNRTETLTFSHLLNKNRIRNEVVSTPSQLGEVCGISVKFLNSNLSQALRIFRQNNFLSFSSFYSLSYNFNGNLVYDKINVNFY